MNCLGPCLDHCCNKKYLYIFLGILIGMLLYHIYVNNK